MSTTELKGLTYEERQALPVIRKLLRRKPELVTFLLEDTTKEAATTLLLQVRDELNLLLAMNKAFSAAAAELVMLDKQKTDAGNGIARSI